MKLKPVYTFLLLILSMHTFAQKVRLQIQVFNDKQESVPNASAALYLLHGNSLVTTKVLDTGIFFMVAVNTRYRVRLTAVGMQDTSIAVAILQHDLTTSVTMFNKINNLNNVTVFAKKPLIKQEDDKTIVDAEVLANSSTNAYEILEKTPGVIVDQDGNVYLSSTTAATVLINGREMKLSSADLASLLKNLPAGSVSKIEILRTPSAKFDASGSGGMLNIVLKKGVKLGFNGGLNTGYFQGVYPTGTIGFNVNKGTGKTNTYLSYQYTNRNNFEELNSDRFIRTDSTLLVQRAFTKYPATSNYISAGIDVQLNEKFNIGYDFRISRSTGKSNAYNDIDIIKIQSNSTIGINISEIKNANNTTFIGNNFSAKYKIDTTGSEWTADVDYNYYKSRNTQFYSNQFNLPMKPTVTGDGDNGNSKHVLVLQTDLVLKRSKQLTLEAGFKITTSNSENSSTYFKDTGNNIKFVDVFQTNTFTYKENITAAYLQASKTFFGFILKAGLRLETTDIRGQQIVPKDTSLFIKRTDLFPYVFIKHKLFNMFGVPLMGNAIFRRSIKRPYYEILNPYPKYVDQYLFDVGNPNLKPQFTTNYELNVSFDNIPVLALGINNTRDIFSNVTYQDNATRIAYRTYDNLGKNKEFYAKIIGGIPPGKKYFFYLGALYNHNEYIGFYEGLPFNYKRSTWTFFMFQELKFTSKFSVNMQGFMRTKGLQNLYELNTFGGLFVSANKSILKKKANIVLSVSDVFRTNQVGFALDQGNVSARGERINDSRRIGITFRYNFGIKPKTEKKNMFEIPADLK